MKVSSKKNMQNIPNTLSFYGKVTKKALKHTNSCTFTLEVVSSNINVYAIDTYLYT